MTARLVPHLRPYFYCALGLGLTLGSFAATAQDASTETAAAASDPATVETIPAPEAAAPVGFVVR